jgi:hypothetical protein
MLYLRKKFPGACDDFALDAFFLLGSEERGILEFLLFLAELVRS